MHAAHLRMCTHELTYGHTHLHAHAYVSALSCTRIDGEPVNTSANIIKLNPNRCIRKLIRYNASPLNVNFHNKMSSRG